MFFSFYVIFTIKYLPLKCLLNYQSHSMYVVYSDSRENSSRKWKEQMNAFENFAPLYGNKSLHQHYYIKWGLTGKAIGALLLFTGYWKYPTGCMLILKLPLTSVSSRRTTTVKLPSASPLLSMNTYKYMFRISIQINNSFFTSFPWTEW